MGLFDRLTERVGGIFEEFIEEVSIPDELHQRLRRAVGLHDRGQYQEALLIIQSIEHVRNDIARVHLVKGMCLFHLGQAQPAAVALRKAIELREDANAHFWAGLSMERMHQWREAQDHFLRARSLDANFTKTEVAFSLGRVYLAQGRIDKALKELRIALRDADESAQDIRITLAKALFQRGNMEDAKAALPPQAEAVIEEIDHAILYATLHEESGDTLKGYAYWRRALELPGNMTQTRQASLGAARGALRTQDFERVEQILKELANQGQEHTDVALLWGRLYETQRHWEAAISAYEQATKLHPTHGQAWLGLGRSKLAQDNPKHALEAFERAMEAETARDESAALLGQGMARLKMEDLSGAKQVLDEALRLEQHKTNSTHLAMIHVTLSEAARRAGDFVEALMVLRKAEEEVKEPEAAKQIEQERRLALEQLRPRWDGLPKSLDQPLDVDQTLNTLQDYITSDARLIDFLPSVSHMIRTMQSPLSVAIVGEFNAGKSTLINSLLGEAVLPTGVLPTTAHTGMIQYGPRRSARVIYNDQEVEELDYKSAKQRMKQNSDEIHHLVYTFPHPQLRVVHFWDTPGFNALEDRHDDVAAKALDEAEAILWVLDANQVLSQTEFERLEAIAEGKERVLVVINKVDRLDNDPEAIAHLLSYVEEHASESMLGCYPISALQALQSTKDESTPMPEAFATFQAQLEEKIFDRATQIKVLEAKRQLIRLTLTLSAFQHGLIQRYQTLREQAQEIGAWVAKEHPIRATRSADHEAMEFEDQLAFLLRAIVKEVDESLRPKSTLSLTPKMQFAHQEDRTYLLTLLHERFDGMLRLSRERISSDVVAFEAEVARRCGGLIQNLSVQDGRGVRRRLEGFQDEVRVLKLLLEERVYGQLQARAVGQIGAAGAKALEVIESQQDHGIWRGEFRKLLPDGGDHFRRHLAMWYDTLFDAAQRLCTRVERDLMALELEAQHRYDLSAIEALVGMQDEAWEEGE